MSKKPQECNQQVDSYIFPSSTVNKMKKSIEKTHETNKEHELSLCIDESTNKIYNGPEHTEKGKNGAINFESECKKKNQKHVGTFHTHVSTDSSEASAMDIHNNCQEYNLVDCIGSPKDGKIMCMTKTNPKTSCRDKVKHLVEEEDILLTTNQGDDDKLYSELDKVIRENFRTTELKQQE